MNNEEKFKKSLSDLINSKEFPFDESNWEKASGLIDNSRSKNRKTPFIILSTVLFITLGLSGFYLLNSNEFATIAGADTKAITNTSNTSVNNTDGEATTIKKSNTLPKADMPLTKHASSQTKEIKQNTEKLPTKNSPIESALPQTIVKEKALMPSPEKEIITSMNPSATKESTSPVTVLNFSKTLPVINESSNASDDNSTPAKEIQMVTETKDSKNSDVTHYEKPTSAVSAIAPATLEPTTITPEINHTEAPVPAMASTIKDSVQSLTEASPIQNLMGVGISPTMPKADSAMLQNDVAVVFQPKDKPAFISIEAGVTYLSGWKNPGSTDAKGYNPMIGMNYFQNVNDKLSVSLGLQYTSISNLNYSTHVTKVTRLNLGEESKVTVFTPVKVHYMIAPLRFHYNLNYLSTIGLGCNFAYLLTVETEIETYDQTINSTGGHSLSKDKGYTEGFTPFDVQLNVFYRRKLHSNLSINAEMFYGLTDIKNNQFFHSNVFERNTGLKLSLVYTINKK